MSDYKIRCVERNFLTVRGKFEKIDRDGSECRSTKTENVHYNNTYNYNN